MKINKLSFLLFAASLLGQSQLFAQATWIGAGTIGTPAFWSEPLNWTGTAPFDNATTSLTFLNAAANSFSNNDVNNLTVSGITIPANDGAAIPVNIKDNTISGNSITLTGTLTVSTGNWQRFNLPIALSGNRTFAINSGVTFLNNSLSGASGAITKTGGGELLLSGSNSFSGGNVTSIGDERLNINTGSTVTLESTNALGSAGGWVRFANGQTTVLNIRTDNSINEYNLTGGSSTSVGSVTLGRKNLGAAYSQPFSIVDLGSRTMNFNTGSNIDSGSMVANIGQLRMSAGNNDRPVTLAGSADITVGSASITNALISKRLQLDGTSLNNQFTGAINDGANGSRLSLIKANASTWKSMGNNVYTGTTTVNGGTLILDQAALCDAALVSIATGAVLDLNHTATDVVDSLSLNGVDQPNGDYDSSTPGGFITGTGKIKVAKTSVHIGADASLWSNAATWTANGLTAPASSGISDLTFMSQTNRSSTNDLTNLTASSIYFPVGGRDNTLNGTDALTLAGDVTVATGNFQTINMPLAISGNRNFVISTGRLTVNGIVSDGLSSGAITKSGGGSLFLGNANTLTGNGGNSLVFSGAASAGFVVLTNPAGLGAAGRTARFSAGGSGTLEIQTDTSVNAYNIASGSGHGGTITANRATSGASISHVFGSLDLSSVTMTINRGGNVTGTAAVSFTDLRMTGGNDSNPVRIAGSADITLGSASITSTGIPKRLQLDGTSANNVITGVISDTSNATSGTPRVSLIKANSSTWHLQGNNTYTGNTTINAGTLRLDFPCLDDATTITIDGTLNLTHNQTDTVNKLFIGGVEQAPGLYKAVGAPGAGTPIPQLTGTGKLNVLTGVVSDPFASWALTNITSINPAADATAGGDPDGDGVTNLSEFAFKGNPLSGSDNGIVRVFTADSSADVDTNRELILTIAIRKGGAAFAGAPLQLAIDGVTYTIQGSIDLSNLAAAVTEVTPITTGLPDLSADPSYEYRSFSLNSSNGLAGRGFLRAKVEK